jgi:hypothetical protein
MLPVLPTSKQKAHQLPFPTSSSICTRPLELLFFDVWGTFIDAFSKFTWLFPIQCKSNVFLVFSQFLLMVD